MSRSGAATIILAAAAIAGVGPADSPEALIGAGHFKRARARVEQRFASNPNEAESLWLMSWIRQIWGDRAAALDYAGKAVKLNGRDARYHLRLAEVLGESAQNANVLEQFGLVARFKKEIEATLALDPGNVKALRHLMEYSLVAPSIAGGSREKAAELAGRISRIDPVEGALAQARMARHDRREEKLEEIYRKAVLAAPSNYDGHVALGNYYRSATVKRFAEAERHGRIAVQLEPGSIDAYNLLAVTLAAQRKWSELDEVLAQAEKQVPDNLAPYYRAASECLELNTEFGRAERYLRRYLSVEPEPRSPTEAQAHRLLGQVNEKQGRRGGARAEYRESVKLDPKSPAREDLHRLE